MLIKSFFIALLIFSSPGYAYSFKNLTGYESNSLSSYKKRANLEDSLSMFVNKASNGEAVLVTHFEGPDNLIGVVLKGVNSNGKHMYGWVTPDLNNLIIGQVFGKDGFDKTELAEKFIQEQRLKNFPFEEQKNALKDSGHIKQYPDMKNVDSDLYVFVDLGCSYSYQFYKEVQEEDIFKENNIQIYWVLVGLNEEDIQKSAYLIYKNSLDVLESTFADDVKKYNNKEVHKEIVESVVLNNFILYTLSEKKAVPALMWADSKKGSVISRVGAPGKDDFFILVDQLKSLVP